MTVVTDDIQEKKTPTDSSSEEPNKKTDPQNGDKSGVTDKDKSSEKDEPMIPKHRFDEVRRVGEQAQKDLAVLQQKMEAMGEALSGKKADGDASGAVKTFAGKYNLDESFVRDLLSFSKAEAKRELQEELKPLKAQQAQAYLANEFAALADEIPEARDMSKEEKQELAKMAVEKKYQNVPLADIWRIKNFGKPQGKSKTAESSRGGASKPTDEEVDIKNMSLADFEKYSASLSKKKK